MFSKQSFLIALLFSMVVWAGFSPKDTCAAPSISSVSGTVSNGNTITVSGSGFGTNTSTQEWTGSNIESGTVGQLFSKSRWSDMDSWSPVYYANDQSHSGAKSLKVTVDPGNNWNGLFTYNFSTPISPGGTGYLTWWVRVGASTAAGQWKMLRLSQANTVGDGPQEFVLFNWNDASGSQRVIDPGTSNDQTEWDSVGFPRSNSTWQRVELVMNASNANQTNGSNTLGLYNGSTYASSTWSGTRNFTSSGQQYNYALFQNYMGNGISGNVPVWFDDILIQNGIARVELCDVSSWSGRRRCEIQPNASWSSSSVGAVFNQGSFTSGQTAYLYVIDSAGTPNPTGYPVTIGGGGGTTYTVTPSAGANGDISPNTAQTVNSGATTAFSVTANTGYTATVGGTCSGSPSTGTGTFTYTTNAITANCTVSATFASSGDTTPPTSPTNLSANATSQSSITVSWNPSTDNVGVTGYIVERCQGTGCSTFTQVGTPAVFSFVDSGLTANTFYNYHVRARDAANNLSGWSNVVGATTQGGTPAPAFTLSANPTTITSGQSSTLTWSAVTNATSCTASGGTFTGTKSTSGGTQSVSPTSTITYTLSCTGAGGTTDRSATVTVTNPNELILDNTDAGTSQSGTWLSSTAYPGYYGSDYLYSSTTNGEWFEWSTSSLTAGTYEVYARWPATAGRPTDVSYRITHNGTADTVGPVNQETNGSQWNLLGTYTFGTTGSVRVIGTATGWEGTAADAIRFVKVTTAPCHTVNTTNFSNSAYNAYGAPFDPYQTSTNLMQAQCTSGNPNTLTATLGVTGDTTRIVYTRGYWYDSVGAAWRQYTGTCTGALNGDWCQGSVSATITDPNVSTASAANPTYLVGMTCSVQGGSWKCGCRDTSCTNFYWQIQGAGQ